MKKLKRWILHPFLLGIYPVVALLAHNIRETTPIFALRSLIFTLVLASAILFVTHLISRNLQKAALLTSLAMLLLFSYGRTFTLLEYTFLMKVKIAGHHVILPILYLIGFAVASWLILRKLNLPSWTSALNIFSLVAVLLSVAQIARYEVRNLYVSSKQALPADTTAGLNLHLLEGKSPPDIYYIILDMYTRNDSMEANLGFDNSPFLDELTKRGFYIAQCSQSNYPTTYPSLTSSLNFNYLPALSRYFTPPNTEIIDLYPYLQDNAVQRALRNLGYKIVGFESGFSPDEFHDADYYFSTQTDLSGSWSIITGGLNPFEIILMQTSAGIGLYNYSIFHPVIRPFFDYSYLTFRNRMLYAMDKLPDIPSIPGPKFVFVHLIAPHNPFAFGPDGEVIVRKTPFALNNDLDAQPIAAFTSGYTGEVTYLDKRFLDIIDQIMEKSAIPPVIILQGDHGIPRFTDWNMTNLNAYYLPDGGERSLYPSISPVNSFRVIFNTYFGGNLSMLPDQACDSTRDDPFRCQVKVDPDPACRKP